MKAEELTQLLKTHPAGNQTAIRQLLVRAARGDAPQLELALALVHLRAPGAMTSLLAALENASLYLLVNKAGDWNHPLILENASSEPFLAGFTSESAADAGRQAFSRQRVPEQVDVAQICQAVNGVLGLVLNPHDETMALHLAPDPFGKFRDVVRTHGAPEVGGIYSVRLPDGGCHLLKILLLEKGGIHARLDSQSLTDRPTDVVTPSLHSSWEHLAVTYATFAAWSPLLIETEPVDAKELEVYELWQQTGGHYFDERR